MCHELHPASAAARNDLLQLLDSGAVGTYTGGITLHLPVQAPLGFVGIRVILPG